MKTTNVQARRSVELRPAVTPAAGARTKMERFAQFFPGIVVGAAALYLLVATIMPHYGKDQIQLGEFASLPAVDGGRVKPIDTLARTTLMIISGKQTFTDENKRTQPAVKWLLDALVAGPAFKSDAALHYKVFRIENDQVLSLLKLEPRPGLRYSYDEFRDQIDVLRQEYKRVKETDEKQRNLFDNKILELANHVGLFTALADWSDPLLLPPLQDGEDWGSLLDGLRSGQPRAEFYTHLLSAYQKDDAQAFNKLVDGLHKELDNKLPSSMSKAGFEVFFNHFAPFYRCAELYVFVFLLACLSWLGWSPLNRAAFWLAVMTLSIHSLALVGRMYLQDRPLVMVTNLYSSAVFIGWGGVFVGLFLEWIYRNGIGNVVGAALGGLTLVIAHYLSTSGDTLEMMQAVLDTNFWLATHVTCVTFGYTATFVAGFIGIGYVITGIFTRVLRDGEVAQNLTKMIYGVACFATLLSFTGTVLGGIWADQSWGRFWGWDVKENGALIIVLWNALILHARWAGMVKARGLALLAIGGNIVTSWSWFGVNMLNVGLHTYGPMGAGLFWLLFFVGSQLALIALGLLPLRMWASFAPSSAVPADSLRSSNYTVQSST